MLLYGFVIEVYFDNLTEIKDDFPTLKSHTTGFIETR